MTAALDARGLKRVCVECGIRFYDMNKRPIVCPSCNTEFTGIEKIKGRKGRAVLVDVSAEKDTSPIADSDATDNDEIDESSDATELNLDDVAAMEEADEDEDEDTLDIDLDGDMDELDTIDVDDLDDEDLDDLDALDDDD